MKSIKIIKRKPTPKRSESITAQKKSEHSSTREIVNTVKGWVEESQQRKRNQRYSLTVLGLLILLGFMLALPVLTFAK